MSDDTKTPTADSEWLDLASRAYENSTRYVDSNYRTQWVNNQKLFNSMHPTGSKYNTELYTKRSRVFRPKTRTSVMKFEAAAASAYFSTQDIVDIAPQNETIEEQIITAKVLDNLLQYRLTKTIPWFLMLCGGAQEAAKMGCVCSKQYWAFDEANEIDGPRIELIPIEEIRIDKNADWADPAATSPFFIRRIPMHVHEVKAKIKDGTWSKVDVEDLQSAKKVEYDNVRGERQGKNKQDPATEDSGISDYDIVYIHENIMKFDGRDHHFYTLGISKLLNTPQDLDSVYPYGNPYVIGFCVIEPFKAYKSGIVELGQTLQEEINDLTNMRLDNVKLVLNKRYFGKRGRNIDFKSLLRNIAGSITMMDHPEDDIRVVETPDITQSSYIENDRLSVEHDELVGNFSQSSIQTNRNLNETVGGLGLMQSGASQTTEYMLRIFNETWVEKVLRMIVRMEQIYEEDEVILATATRGLDISKFMRDDGSIDTDRLLDQDIIVNVNVGMTAINPQMKVERLLFAVNSLGQIMQSPVSQIMSLKPVVEEIFGLLGYRDGVRFFKALEEGKDPEIQRLEQELAQMQQMLESKQLEIQAKQEIEKAKLQLESQKMQIDSALKQTEMQAVQTDAQKTAMEIEKLKAEIQRLYAGTDDVLKSAELRLREMSLMDRRNEILLKNKTERDKILAQMDMKTEENEAKLKITLANQARGTAALGNVKSKAKESDSKKKVVKAETGYSAEDYVNEPDIVQVSEKGQPEIVELKDGKKFMTTEKTNLPGRAVKEVTPENEIKTIEPTQTKGPKTAPMVALRGKSKTLGPEYRAVAESQGMAPELIQAVIRAESGGRQNAKSNKGAVGLMQLTPIAVEEINRVKLLDRPITFEEVKNDPLVNVEAGTAYLRYLQDEFQDLDMTLAAYNAGPTKVRKLGRVPNIKETKDYIEKIKGFLGV